MTIAQKRGLSWALAALMTAALMTFVLLCTNVQYITNDDAGVLRAFMGYETGEPATFHIFIHGLLALPLGWISRLVPETPWFSYLQLALLALSCVVLAKSIMQCFVNREKPLWMGALFALGFLTVLCMKYITRLTFTQTAALLGAAAAAQMLSIPHDRGGWRVVVGMAGALALVCLGYALRQSALLPFLGFCGLIYVLLVWEHYGLGKKAIRSLRPMVISLVMIAVVLAGMVGVRQLELSDPQRQEYLAWQEANTEIMDYVGIQNVPAEAFEQVGWDESLIAMTQNWCFLDSTISTEAFLTLSDALEEPSLGEKVSNAFRLLGDTAAQNPLDMRCIGIALFVGLLALLGAAHKGSLRLILSVLAVTGLSVVMVVYLALAGRLPMRAMLVAVLPAAAALFALLPACLPRFSIRITTPLMCVCFGAAMILNALEVVPTLLIDKEADLELGSPMTDLEEYATWEPESLFLYDDTLSGADLRVFPQFEDGMPTNVLSWGGWGLRSPESVQLFERFDIDLFDIDPAVFLRDDVYIASARVDPPPMLMLNWLHSRLGENIDWEIYSEYGSVYLFHFYEY